MELLKKIWRVLAEWIKSQVFLPVEPPSFFDISTFPIETPDKEKLLLNMMLAIRKMEGWYEGSRSFRNNNAGNCKFSSVGYLPMYEPVKKDPQGFAIFKDYTTGWLYLKNLILSKAKKHPEWSLGTFFREYAPVEDDNNPAHYASVVAEKMGVSPYLWELKNLL